MSKWGKGDSANSIPSWVTALVNKTSNTTVKDSLYNNSSTSAIIPGQKVGIFKEPTGWVLKKEGTGGRAGRVSKEILFAAGDKDWQGSYEAARYWMGGSCTDFGSASVFTNASASNQFGTTLHCIELQGEFTEIQLILANMSSSAPIEYVGASAVAVSDMSDKKQDALFASEAKLFAFGQNGNPTITVPARTGQNVTLAASICASL